MVDGIHEGWCSRKEARNSSLEPRWLKLESDVESVKGRGEKKKKKGRKKEKEFK